MAGKGGKRGQGTQAAGRNVAGALWVRSRLTSRVAELSCKETWVAIPVRPSYHPSQKGHLRVLE